MQCRIHSLGVWYICQSTPQTSHKEVYFHAVHICQDIVIELKFCLNQKHQSNVGVFFDAVSNSLYQREAENTHFPFLSIRWKYLDKQAETRHRHSRPHTHAPEGQLLQMWTQSV